jgi:hypothetical protein
MRDSVGNDTVLLAPNAGSIKGPGESFVNTVAGVSSITVYSIRGGNDTLTMNGSTKSADQVTSWMDSITMWDVVAQTGGNNTLPYTYNNRTIGFTDNITVNAGANSDKNTVTIIERVDASVRLVADPEMAKLYRGTPAQEQPNLTFNQFNSVIVTAQEKTKLTASLTGSSGNDTLVATDTQVTLSGKRSDKAAYSIQVNHFANCVVDAGAGSDTATFTSGKGGEHLSMLDDRKTFELFAKDDLDDALLKLIAFESIKFDAAKNKCTADDTIANIKKNALIDIDLVGDWVKMNR